MKSTLKIRRAVLAIVLLFAAVMGVLFHPEFWQASSSISASQDASSGDALLVLNQLEVKGRAPKTGYSRDQFGDGWATLRGCDMRNTILARDLMEVKVNEKCQVVSGILQDTYTGKRVIFSRGEGSSDDVQIDHVVALSDAWQKGAQQLSSARREELANDPLELLAVDGAANQQKSDGDAATWLPPQKAFRCQYVARQVAVKKKYNLWVTVAEKEAITRVLSTCPGQALP